MVSRIIIIGALVAILAGYIAPGFRHTLTVLGVWREARSTHTEAHEFVLVDDTIQCEDLHHHLPSGLLFTACQDDASPRYSWFPPLGNFDDPLVALASRGSIHVVDPKTLQSQRLSFENFEGPFVTHGIDVMTDKEDPSAVYILAVNHVPDADYIRHHELKRAEKDYPSGARKSHSRVEIFHHALGSSSVRHLRTVWHPLFNTPNDIYAASPSSFYVTNDHFYADGHMRLVEDLYPGATWSNTLHVQVKDLAAKDPSAQVEATVALTGLHMNNGLGHGRRDGEMVIGCAAPGTIHLATLSSDHRANITQTLYMGSSVDNPSYFADPYPEVDRDGSGFVIAGLTRAVDLRKAVRDPSVKMAAIVWFVRSGGPGDEADAWKTSLMFEDDGFRVNTGTTGVLVAIDPATEGGKKKAWLFTTGFVSDSIIAAKVDI